MEQFSSLMGEVDRIWKTTYQKQLWTTEFFLIYFLWKTNKQTNKYRHKKATVLFYTGLFYHNSIYKIF